MDPRPKAFCLLPYLAGLWQKCHWSEPASLWSLSLKHCAVLSPQTHTAACVPPLRCQRLKHSQVVHFPATSLSPFQAALLRAADARGPKCRGSFASRPFGGRIESLVLEHVYCSFPSCHPSDLHILPLSDPHCHVLTTFPCTQNFSHVLTLVVTWIRLALLLPGMLASFAVLHVVMFSAPPG